MKILGYVEAKIHHCTRVVKGRFCGETKIFDLGTANYMCETCGEDEEKTPVLMMRIQDSGKKPFHYLSKCISFFFGLTKLNDLAYLYASV